MKQIDKRLEKATKEVHKALKKHYSKTDGFWVNVRNLCGACAIGAFVLKAYARKKYGIRLTVIKRTTAGEEHCWCEYKGVVYDPTYQQFDYTRKVHVGERCFPHLGRRKTNCTYRNFRGWAFNAPTLQMTNKILRML